jgi:hypothetical protein
MYTDSRTTIVIPVEDYGDECDFQKNAGIHHSNVHAGQRGSNTIKTKSFFSVDVKNMPFTTIVIVCRR